MACTRAVLQFSNAVLGIAEFGVRITPVVTRMTTCAIGSVRRIFPGGRIRIGGVALGTCPRGTVAVIARILTGRVLEDQRGPPRGVVADITITRGGHVAGVLARGLGTIVTGRAAIGDASVTERGRFPRQG